VEVGEEEGVKSEGCVDVIEKGRQGIKDYKSVVRDSRGVKEKGVRK